MEENTTIDEQTKKDNEDTTKKDNEDNTKKEDLQEKINKIEESTNVLNENIVNFSSKIDKILAMLEENNNNQEEGKIKNGDELETVEELENILDY